MAAHKYIARYEALLYSPLPHFDLSVALRIGILYPESQIWPGTFDKENSLLSYRLGFSVSRVCG